MSPGVGDFIDQPQQLPKDVDVFVGLLEGLGVLFQVQFLQSVSIVQDVALYLRVRECLLAEGVPGYLDGEGVVLGVDTGEVQTGHFLVAEPHEGHTVVPFPRQEGLSEGVSGGQEVVLYLPGLPLSQPTQHRQHPMLHATSVYSLAIHCIHQSMGDQEVHSRWFYVLLVALQLEVQQEVQ